MTDSPYAVPEEDLFDRARVPVELQVVEQPERRLAGGEEASGPLPFEGSVDADGA